MTKNLFWCIIAVLIFMATAGMSGCTRKVYVPVERVRTELVRSDTSAMFERLLRIVESRKEKSLRIDSLIDKEKELVVMNERGDTTRHNKERIVYRATEREKELESENKTLRDSLSVLNTRLESIKTDSIPVIIPVERELSKWEKAKMDFGGAAIIGAVLLFVGLCIAVWWMIKIKK